MTKRKSFLMILAMVLILPFALMFSACGKTETKYSVSFGVNNTEYGSVNATSFEVAEGTSVAVDGATITIGNQVITATPSDVGYYFVEWQGIDNKINSTAEITAVFDVRGADYFESFKFMVVNETEKTVSVGIDEELYDFEDRARCFTGTLEIPKQIKLNGEIYTTTKIADYGFYYTCIDKFILPNTITEFGFASFACCYCLQQFVIPENVTTIGEYALAEDVNLFEVWNLSNLVVTNQNEGEYDCLINSAKYIYTDATQQSKVININGLKYWPNSETDYTLIGADNSVTTISNIDARAKTIGDYAFIMNSNLIGANLTGIQTVGFCAFADCENLTSVNLTGVQTLGSSAFSGSGLESVDFSVSEITTISNGAFDLCLSLASVNLTGIQKIEDSAFECCYTLSGITLPTTLTEIGENAFDRCYSLIEVWNFSNLTLKYADEEEPYSVIKTNGKVSYYARQIYTTNEPSKVITENGLMYWEEEGGHYSLLGTTDKTITTLSNLKVNTYKVEAYAFYNCKNLTSADLTGIQYLSEGAFRDCENLTTVTLTEENEIHYGVFENCYKLANIDLSKTTYIYNFAFRRCYELTNVDLRMIERDDYRETFGAGVFQYCKKLESVRLGNCAITHSEIFEGCNSLKTIYIEGAIQYNEICGDIIIAGILRQMTNVYVLKSIYDSNAHNAYLTNSQYFVQPTEVTTIGGVEYYLFTPIQA